MLKWGQVLMIRLRTLRWRHNERDCVSNHQPHDCLLNRLFTRRSKNTSKLRVTGLCAENSPVTGEFPAPRASNAETVSIDDVIMICWSWDNHTIWPIPGKQSGRIQVNVSYVSTRNDNITKTQQSKTKKRCLNVVMTENYVIPMALQCI